ncbi:MAG: CsbD family protein [Desulfuromonadales bacterium]|nr:CsbD family protein [Desulfuromonadales bacterium]
MSSSIKDKIEGTFHAVKGQVKKTTGKLIKNTELEADGTGEKIAGQTQRKVGQVKKVFGE